MDTLANNLNSLLSNYLDLVFSLIPNPESATPMTDAVTLVCSKVAESQALDCAIKVLEQFPQYWQ